MINCAQCSRDISSESFKYEADDGRILCEECFHGELAAAGPHEAKFVFLKSMMRILKVLAFVSLVGGALLANSSYEYSAVLSVGAALCGIVMFLVCLIASELTRLGLSLEEGIHCLSLSTDRLLSMLSAQGKGTIAPERTHEQGEQ